MLAIRKIFGIRNIICTYNDFSLPLILRFQLMITPKDDCSKLLGKILRSGDQVIPRADGLVVLSKEGILLLHIRKEY